MSGPVFTSDIERGLNPLKNRLEDLLEEKPAQPVKEIKQNENNTVVCNFQPHDVKYFIPKQRYPKCAKVLTVAEIRKEFEKEAIESLDLEKKENYVLQKVRLGSISEKCKSKVKNLLESDIPSTKICWQMLANLNLNNKLHPIQYVLWHGKNIRINGSVGGDKKYILHYDLGKKRVAASRKNKVICNKPTNNTPQRKCNLLQKSLSVKFKPGPLRRKTELDISYQKYSVSKAKVTKLPQIALTVTPTLGTVFESTISNILQTQREVNGTLTEKWAEFSSTAIQFVDRESGSKDESQDVVFNLEYKNNQKYLLMREHDGSKKLRSNESISAGDISNESCDTIEAEVKLIMNEMLHSVEVGINEDIYYTGVDEPREEDVTDFPVPDIPSGREKSKRKYGELQRLDVTVITLEEIRKVTENSKCKKRHCAMGCVCPNIGNVQHFKQHCGRVECMFECKCNFSRYKAIDELNGSYRDLIPGLIQFENDLNSKLAKEEQKFHQTVVLTDDKSIVLKPQKRNLHAPKRYAEYLKKANVSNKILSIDLIKIPSTGIEPWCMVHNLYKCFCKGKFVTSYQHLESMTSPIQNDHEFIADSDTDKKNQGSDLDPDYTNYSSLSETDYENEKSQCCARIRPFKYRRYNSHFYSMTNEKIKLMEERDVKLKKRLSQIVGSIDKNTVYRSDIENDNSDISNDYKDIEAPESANEASESNAITVSSSDEDSNDVEYRKRDMTSSNTSQVALPNKAKLISWLEANYRRYKERLASGSVNIPIEAPKPGKIALYPWLVILERYRLKKNYFCVTKSQPYRIFMAVSLNDDFFSNCISVDTIPFKDIRKYPVTVRNLLQDASDLVENFYILCGLSKCWELIGSVSKLDERCKIGLSSKTNSDADKTITERKEIAPAIEIMDTENDESSQSCDSTVASTPSDESKWFIMTVKEDFTEIQFYKKGFFVKYANMMKAVSVSQVSGKTVRLSCLKNADESNGPQFGVYAVPTIKEACVFIGPYEKDEPLGIEYLKKNNTVHATTKGYWIRTKKIDDLQVIDNPLYFIAQSATLGCTQVLPYQNTKCSMESIPLVKSYCADNVNDSVVSKNVQSTSPTEPKRIKLVRKSSLNSDAVTIHPSQLPKIAPRICLNSDIKSNTLKVVKPILIKKYSKFNLVPNESISLLKNVRSLVHNNAQDNISADTCSTNTNEEILTPIIKETFSLSENADKPHTIILKKPVAEVAPQVNTLKAPDTSTPQVDGTKKMMILQPTQINERFLELATAGNKSASHTVKSNSEGVDIEDFLATSQICTSPFGEFNATEEDDNSNVPKPVWIESTNISELGWIPGKRNKNKEISFEFPGFKYTDFYPEQEAFTKINQVLSRKVYVPKSLKVIWRVVESLENLNCSWQLKADLMGPAFVLTNNGIKCRNVSAPNNDMEIIKKGLKQLRAIMSSSSSADTPEKRLCDSPETGDSDMEMKFEIDEEM